MFQKFLEKCKIKDSANYGSPYLWHENSFLPVQFFNLLSKIKDCSFENGAFQIIDLEEMEKWNGVIASAFCDAKNFIPFGRDWLNRIYAVQRNTGLNGDVFLVSHLTDEFFPFQGVPLVNFFDNFLPGEYQSLLDTSLFNQLLKKEHIETLKYDQGVEMKTPLFLGGDFVVENMGICESLLDWEITTQLLQKVREMQFGEGIAQVGLVAE